MADPMIEALWEKQRGLVNQILTELNNIISRLVQEKEAVSRQLKALEKKIMDAQTEWRQGKKAHKENKFVKKLDKARKKKFKAGTNGAKFVNIADEVDKLEKEFETLLKRGLSKEKSELKSLKRLVDSVEDSINALKKLSDDMKDKIAKRGKFESGDLSNIYGKVTRVAMNISEREKEEEKIKQADQIIKEVNAAKLQLTRRINSLLAAGKKVTI